MFENRDLDSARQGALDRIDRSERRLKAVLLGAAVWEGLFLLVLLFAADFHNRVHLLIVVSAVGVYTLVAIGLIALATHVSRVANRVLYALELLREKKPD